MESFNPQSDAAKPCTGGCGFFGSAPLDFYCSLCFKKARGEAEFIERTRAKERKEEEEKQKAEQAESDVAQAAQPMDEEPAPEPAPSPEPAVTKCIEVPTPESSTAAAAASPAAEGAVPKKKPGRCWTCNKKVGLTGFHCRCEGVFCGVHRYSDKHECPFDYKALGREQLTKANPTVAAEKLERI